MERYKRFFKEAASAKTFKFKTRIGGSAQIRVSKGFGPDMIQVFYFKEIKNDSVDSIKIEATLQKSTYGKTWDLYYPAAVSVSLPNEDKVQHVTSDKLHVDKIKIPSSVRMGNQLFSLIIDWVEKELVDFVIKNDKRINWTTSSKKGETVMLNW